MNSLSRALDEEFKRIAKEEDVSMGELVEQVALLAETSSRSLYNFRSGKWPLPSHLIPILCRRFRSRALLDVLNEQIKDAPVDLPVDQASAWDVCRAGVKELCALFELVNESMIPESTFDHRGLDQIEEISDRIARHCRLLHATAVHALETKSELRRKRA